MAIALARTSAHVTAIDISQPCLDAARCSAGPLGERISFRRKSADDLIFDPLNYEVIIASQVLHWVDPPWACPGIAASLVPGGMLFAIESKASLPAGHPLREHMNYGRDVEANIPPDCLAHAKKHLTLFRQAGQPDIRLAGVWLFRERRRFDTGFAKAYFFDEHMLRAFRGHSDPWAELGRRLGACGDEALWGSMYWLLAKYVFASDIADASDSAMNLSINEILAE
jgi:hypothetical protein